MFRIKICGVTSVNDAQMIAAAGADTIGLNFYPKSPRFVDPSAAAEIVASLPAEMLKVGVFVNADLSLIGDLYDRLNLDLVQLHGDEPPETVAALAGRPVMRAFRSSADNPQLVLDYLRQCQSVGRTPDLTLLDAQQPGQYGGTGLTLNWAKLAKWKHLHELPPVVLAGGLTPNNVAEAIETVRPFAVDTASGVEQSPGIKDASRTYAFVAAARNAFEQVDRGKLT